MAIVGLIRQGVFFHGLFPGLDHFIEIKITMDLMALSLGKVGLRQFSLLVVRSSCLDPLFCNLMQIQCYKTIKDSPIRTI